MDYVSPTRRESVEDLGVLCEQFTTQAWHAAKQGDYAAAARFYGHAEAASFLAFNVAESAAAAARSVFAGTRL